MSYSNPGHTLTMSLNHMKKPTPRQSRVPDTYTSLPPHPAPAYRWAIYLDRSFNQLGP